MLNNLIIVEIQIIYYRIVNVFEKIIKKFIDNTNNIKFYTLCVLLFIAFFFSYIKIGDINKCNWYHGTTSRMVIISEQLSIEVISFID